MMKRRELLQLIPAAAGASLIPATPRAAGGSARSRSALCAYTYREHRASGKMSYEDLVHGLDGLHPTLYWLPETGLDEHLLSLRGKVYLSAIEIPGLVSS